MIKCETISDEWKMPNEIGAEESIYRYVSSPTGFLGDAGVSPVAFMLFRKKEKDISVERGDGLCVREILEHGEMINMWADPKDAYSGVAKMTAVNIMAIDRCKLKANPSLTNPRHAGIFLFKKDGTAYVNLNKITAGVPIPEDIHTLLLKLTNIVDEVYDRDGKVAYSANQILDMGFEFMADEPDLLEGVIKS